jgi:ketosteroid isomerase-like protein
MHSDLASSMDALASESAIRRLMAAYLDAVDRADDGARIASFFTDDGIFEGIGELLGFLGRHQGRHAIARRFDATREHLTFSVHRRTESIVVGGDRATGTWTYLQAAVHDGQAVWVAGRWRNEFTRAGGEWKIARNACEGIFVAPYQDGWGPSSRSPVPHRDGGG